MPAPSTASLSTPPVAIMSAPTFTTSAFAPATSATQQNGLLKFETSEAATPTNASPMLTPKVGSPGGNGGNGSGLQFQSSFFDLLSSAVTDPPPPQATPNPTAAAAAQQVQPFVAGPSATTTSQSGGPQQQELLLQHLLSHLVGDPDDHNPSDASSAASSLSEGSSSWSRHRLQQIGEPDTVGNRHVGPFRALATNLDPIPENDVTDLPTGYQPLVPPAVPKPATTTYNISFPTTLQPRETRFDFWRQHMPPVAGGSAASPSLAAAASTTTTSAATQLASPSPGNLSSASGSQVTLFP